MKKQRLMTVMKRSLLYGLPGCGKTMLVEAIANELEAALLMARVRILGPFSSNNSE